MIADGEESKKSHQVKDGLESIAVESMRNGDNKQQVPES